MIKYSSRELILHVWKCKYILSTAVVKYHWRWLKSSKELIILILEFLLFLQMIEIEENQEIDAVCNKMNNHLLLLLSFIIVHYI